MVNSTYSIAKAEKGLMADGFQISGQDLKRGLNGTKKPIIPFYERLGDELEESISAGSGGVISSARDMVRSVDAVDYIYFFIFVFRRSGFPCFWFLEGIHNGIEKSYLWKSWNMQQLEVL
jgi:hypothetical protein